MRVCRSGSIYSSIPLVERRAAYAPHNFELIIMAKKSNKVAKATSAKPSGLASILAKHGVNMSEQQGKLWGEPEIIQTGLDGTAFELRVNDSDYAEPTAYIIIKDGKLSRAISFAPEEIDVDDLVANEDGIVEDHDIVVSLGIVIALRDAEDLQVRDLANDLVDIEDGTQTLKAFVE